MFNMSMRIKREEMIIGGQLIFHDAMWWLESGRQLRQAISWSENQQGGLIEWNDTWAALRSL